MTGCDCPDEPLLSAEVAIERMLGHLAGMPATESIGLCAAPGRILAETLHSAVNVPPWDNSAMDGYALCAASWRVGVGMPLAGRVAAGQAGGTLQPGHAARIFTGAPLPEGADTVVPQEDCRVEEGLLYMETLRPGWHVRRRGEETRAGDLLLPAGTLLGSTDIGLLASRGVGRVEVFRRLRIGLASSGDELREPGEALGPGQIHNANRPMLAALFAGWGCEVVDAGTIADRRDATLAKLAELAPRVDLIITTGGVSVGEEDHIRHAVAELGSLHMWRLAIQPGKPLAFGDVAGTTWIGLPGNPVAAFITALMVARPFLWQAMGRTQRLGHPLLVTAGFDWPRSRKRTQFLRARLARSGVASRAVLHDQQGSAQLAALAWAEGLVEIECGRSFEAGERIRYWPLAELLH